MAYAASAMPSGPRLTGRYRWFTAGDINGFFGLIIDNMAVMSFLAFILIGIFKFPEEIVYKHMFPGTALGVLFGDLIYTWMAFSLAKRTGNPNVTAMPLGLDTPSTIGIGFTVLGPAFLAFKAAKLDDMAAGLEAWHLGMGVMILIGVIKVIFSFAGGWVQRIVPQAGLLGSLAGIGLALIGFLPLLDIFGVPVVGLVAMGLLFYAVVAGIRLPAGFPGVLFAIIVGTVLYYVLAPQGLLGIPFTAPDHKFYFAWPTPSMDFMSSLQQRPGLPNAWTYLPIAFPFAILTVIGGINVTESARVAGDNFKTRSILLVEAFATLLAGVTGGVAQSTPYIGQPAYKAMGSRAGYTLLTGLFIGIAGCTGLIGYLVEAIPRAALAPVLIFVALDIMSQAFLACPAMHAPAVGFAYLPTVARMLAIKMGSTFPKIADMKIEKALPEPLVIITLGNGFILTAMLWGAFLSEMINRRLKAAAIYLWICMGLAFFGIIHSADPDGKMYKPWELLDAAHPNGILPIQQQITYQYTAAYAILGIILFLLSFTSQAKQPPEDQTHALVH